MITVGRKSDGKEGVLTTSTFHRIEVEMDIARNSILKLVKYLKGEVNVENNVKEGLRAWDERGMDQLKLERIDNFEQKITAKKGKKGEENKPARVENITRDIVVVRDVAATVDWVVEERGLERSNTAVRISIDGRGGSLKVLASIFDKNEDSEVVSLRENSLGPA